MTVSNRNDQAVLLEVTKDIRKRVAMNIVRTTTPLNSKLGKIGRSTDYVFKLAAVAHTKWFYQWFLVQNAKNIPIKASKNVEYSLYLCAIHFSIDDLTIFSKFDLNVDLNMIQNHSDRSAFFII